MSPICFTYKEILCTIRYEHTLNNYGVKTHSLVCDRVDSEMEIQDFNSTKEMFNNSIIEGKNLKAIWSNIEIISVGGLNKI